MTPPVRLTGVTRTFREVTAVSDVHLTLEAGRIYGLVGPNGSGKTTTLRAIMGLMTPDSGTVELFGGPPDDARRARIGWVPEVRSLPENSRVGEALTFFARMRGWSRAEARSMSATWVSKLALDDKADARIKTLSNGQQQKVQVALALMCGPELILADEPLTALDPNHQDLVTGLLREAAEGGATVILSTHRLREAEHVIDHVVMMAQGRKVLDQPLRAAMQAAFQGVWRIEPQGDDSWLDGPEIAHLERAGDAVLATLVDGATLAPLLARAASAGAPLQGIQAVLPTLHDLYLERVAALGLDAGDVA